MVGGGSMSERFQKLSEEKQLSILQAATEVFAKYDFKENVNPFEIFKMMCWLTDGYIHERQKSNEPLSLDAVCIAFAG